MKNLIFILLILLGMSGMAQTYQSVVPSNYSVNQYADELAVANDGKYAFASQNTALKIRVEVFNSDGTTDWTEDINATAYTVAGSVDFDADGNLYLACVTIGDVSFTNNSSYSFSTPTTGGSYILIKFDPDGNIIWHDNFGESPSNFKIYDMDVNNDDIAICGYYDGTLKGVNADGIDACVYVYDTAGTYQWFEAIGDSDEDRAISVAILGSDVIVSGYFKGSIVLGGVTFTSAGFGDKTNIFIAKYPLTGGGSTWGIRLDGSSGAEYFYLYLASDGNNFYITGKQSDNFYLRNAGEQTIVETTLSNRPVWGDISGAGIHIFTAKYNSSGTVQWGKTIPSKAACEPYGIDHESGQLFLTGMIEDSVMLEILASSDTSFLSAGPGNQDIAFFGVDPSDGDILWGHNLIGTALGGELGADIEASGNILCMLFKSQTAGLDVNHGPQSTTVGAGYFISRYTLGSRDWYASAASSDWHTHGNSSNWVSGYWPSSTDDVTIPTGASNMPTISTTASCNNLTIEDGTSLLGQAYLTTNGTTTGEFTATGYTSSTDGWYFFGAFVANADISASGLAPGANDDLYAWDEPNYLWRNYKDPVNPSTWFDFFDVGVGYLIARDNTETMTFEGDLNTNSSYTLNFTNDDSGWNSWANPFPSDLDWTNVSLTNADSPHTINNLTGSYEPVGLTDVTEKCEGGFAYASSAGASMTVDTADQVHTGSSKKSGDVNQANLTCHFGALSVFTQILIHPDATLAFDPKYDSRFAGAVTPIPYFAGYIESAGIYTSRLAFPSTDQPDVQPIYLMIPTSSRGILMLHGAPVNSEAIVANKDLANEMELTISLEGELLSTDVVLRDNATGAETALSKGEAYTFMASTEDDPWRFSLLFSPVGVEEVESDEPEIRIYPNPVQDVMTIQTNNSESSVFELVNLSGQVMRTFEIHGTSQVDVSDLPVGMYILKNAQSTGIVRILKIQ